MPPPAWADNAIYKEPNKWRASCLAEWASELEEHERNALAIAATALAQLKETTDD